MSDEKMDGSGHVGRDRIPLVIDRSRWYRGLGEIGSALLRKIDGKMCCLGFASLASGADPGEIMNVGAPDGSVFERLVPEGMRVGYTESRYVETTSLIPWERIVALLMVLNDKEWPGHCRGWSSIREWEAAKEEMVAAGLCLLGFDVEFVDVQPGPHRPVSILTQRSFRILDNMV